VLLPEPPFCVTKATVRIFALVELAGADFDRQAGDDIRQGLFTKIMRKPLTIQLEITPLAAILSRLVRATLSEEVSYSQVSYAVPSRAIASADREDVESPGVSAPVPRPPRNTRSLHSGDEQRREERLASHLSVRRARRTERRLTGELLVHARVPEA
jgi:hypothetical protein